MTQKTISFAVPCFNSAAYMDKCIQSLVDLNGPENDVEVLIIDDGSTKDNTLEIASKWQERYPDVCRAIHQTNGGHGGAVNTGIANATGIYYKVVDSDDWLDRDAMVLVMAVLRDQANKPDAQNTAIDMVLANYVYEKVHEGKQQSIGYTNVFPTNRVFSWDDVCHFRTGQYILMHSVIYRTQLLRDIKLELPRHTFYVDNIFVYVPLPHVKTMFYIDVDMYRYFIGREDQSVNEKVMMGRMDQQLRVTRTMIEAVPYSAMENKHLRHYMVSYLSMMMCICSIFLRLRGGEQDECDREAIWQFLKEKDQQLYKKCKNSLVCQGTNLPGKLGRSTGIAGYHLAQKLFAFN